MAKSRGVLSGITLFIGALLFLSGFIFMLQGLGIVGPTSSFMFRSQTWVYEGIAIWVVGLVIIAVGALIRRGSPKKQELVQKQEMSGTLPSSSKPPEPLDPNKSGQ